MKSNKILMAGAAALACVSLASAATTIKLTGSTAFRNSTTQAIINLMGGTGTFKGAYVVSSAAAADEGNLKKAGISIFQGNISGADNPVTIQCSWSGSVGGIYTLTSNSTVDTWIDPSKLPASNGIINYVDASAPSTAIYESASTADVTMSDTLQTSTLFPNPALTKYEVGIVTFVWIKNAGFPASVTNITSLQARALLQGFSPLSLFTGNPDDSSSFVLAVGRNQDSGTRVAALADSGYGSLKAPVQWQLNISGGAVTSAELYPANTYFGITYDLGTTGYSSGSTLATAFNATGSDSAPVNDEFGDEIFSGAYYIGYVGTGDAKKLTGHTQNSDGTFTATNNQVLSYNGVPFSYANVREGKYSFWTVEHLMHRTNLASNASTVASKLAAQIHDTTAAIDGILISTMDVARSVEGGVISHK
jgi:hypothetical protein